MSTLTTRLAPTEALRLIVVTLMVGSLLLLAGGITPVVQARYADGTGQGLYQNQIYWLEWDGFTFADGQSRTFNLPGNVTVVATVSNVSSNPSNGAISVGRPEDYGPAAMNLAYPNTGYTAIKSCDHCTNLFRLTLSADVAGTTVPVDMVVADAEAASSNEYLKVTSDGDAWQLLEQFQAANLRATWSNSDKILELHGNGSTTYGTVLAVSTGVTNFDFEIAGGGVSAAALGVFLPSDYGDAPASFNDAGHYIRQSFTGGLPGVTKVYDPVSTAFTSFATISDAPTVYLGPIKPDADPGTQNAAPNATNAQGDDLNNTDDEDGVASFPPLTRASTSYSVSATAHNTSGGPATLWGWVDFDGNGQFAASEVTSAAVANGANPASVTLNWPAVTVTPAAGSTVYARLRLTTGTLTDNGATPQDERAQGGAADGEVEDYAITIPTDPIKDSFVGCGVITFDSDAQGFRTASTREDRTVNQGPFDAPYGPVDGTKYFRWESTGGNPSGHLRADDLDGEYQEVWTPAFTDPDFSALIGQQIQFDYKNDTGYNQYRLYIAIVGTNGNQYYYYFNNQLGAVGSWSRVKVPMVASAWHTGFEAGENPSTPPDSPAPSAIDFAAVLGNLARFAVSVEGVSGADTSRFDNFGRACDYGDLPESGTSFTTTGANAARHNIADEVRLGALIDSEPDGQPNATADGDDSAFSDDEDSVASFPPLSGATTSYAVTLSARNTSGALATLWGWVDFNNDGQFSPTEVASTSVANGANPANVTLTWSPVSVTVPVGAKAYARFRITTDSLTDNGATPQDERAQGRASDGEVEDYAITVIGDYGDAPASYGDPSHSIPSQGSYLGAAQPDNESGSQHTANAQGDDLSGVDDEDGVTSFPPLNTTSTSYSVSVLANNPSGTAATLYGWVDFNDNGRFSAGEAATAAVPAGTVNGTITLNWSGITVEPAAVGTAYARFRITTASLVDDPGTGQRDERAESAASNGEVEDYRIRTLDFGDAPNDLSSIDASLTNAYRTTLARNGPRHIVDTAIRLGALIDGEADGQPNLAADGDDTNTVDDEDGVAFNPALGISTANVVLSGAQNTLAVTASANGYLSAWIDYNQNGTFTDAGEQLFNDQAVTPGVNTLTFTTPNTAPHGATYMRFRYSTQTGQANVLTGQAPDGEVEDYRVEVALPAPTTCEAGLVNGSFELPVGGNLYPSAQVPGWAFRASNPASGADFDQRHVIEIWTNGQEGVPSYQGNQFAEINGYVFGNLYQDMITVPGQVLTWQFAHRGRQGTDVMALKIGPPGATVQVISATDGTSAWGVYNGSYTVPAGQTIIRFEFEAVSSSGGNASVGNFIDAVSFSLPCDYGDAPDSYGTTAGSNGASHLIANTLALGNAAPDAEGTGFPSAGANGDNLNNTDDENSLASLPILRASDTSYSLSAIPVLNTTGSAVTLVGWIDFNRNGQFEASEQATAAVPASMVEQTASLTWSSLSGLVAGQSYLRLRVSNQTGILPTGVAGVGEVEDYALPIDLPLAVTLASFDAQAQAGHILVTWQTFSEFNTAGFNLYRTLTPAAPAAANLLVYVPSQAPGSGQGASYEFQDTDVVAGETYWYWLEDVDLGGVASMHGPVSVVFTVPTAVTVSGLEASSGQPAFSAWPWVLLLAAAALALAGAAGVRRTNA